MPLSGRKTAVRALLLVLLFLPMLACAQPPLIGLAYTHVHLPLTRDLRVTQPPDRKPSHQKIVEIKEPVSGVGFYARVDSNAIGDIARTHGLNTLYFADQEIFSLFGILNTVRVDLYGEE